MSELGTSPSHARMQRWSVFVPLLILAVTYLAWTVFQTMTLIKERETLTTLRTNQEQQIQNSKKLRENLDKLAKDTRVLADRGNPGARMIVDELRKRGITINLDTAATPPAAPEAVPQTQPAR